MAQSRSHLRTLCHNVGSVDVLVALGFVFPSSAGFVKLSRAT